jgi:agmatine/peptidylarginine deiminase
VAKRLQAEWEEQEALLVVFPTNQKDWQHSITEIQNSYVHFINEIIKYQKCFVLCSDTKEVSSKFTPNNNLEFIPILTNDTWIRDFGGIDFYEGSVKKTYNFTFNAWGGKFDSSMDNQVTKTLFEKGYLKGELITEDFILEGGSIDSNGAGILLTTKKCLFNENRNNHMSENDVVQKLTNLFGLTKVLMLENGALFGDDTDSHVDTLARFLDKDTIAYVKCYDKDDEHFEELNLMEEELLHSGFKLIPLPLPQKNTFANHRLPATYLNFVFINGALIVPTYNEQNDAIVIETLKIFFPHRDVIGVDARVFIREHGSLHCSCMNVYKN